MRLRILPDDQRFYELLVRAGANLVETSEALLLAVRNGTDIGVTTKKIRDFEHTGDTITHEMMRALNRTFVTPLDREDLASLTKKVDDVVDMIWAAATRMEVYAVPNMTAEAGRFAELINEQSQQTQWALAHLKRRSKMDELLQAVREINRVENAADDLLRATLAMVFKDARDSESVVRAIQWREIYEYLELATDRGEDVGDVLEAIVLKYG